MAYNIVVPYPQIINGDMSASITGAAFPTMRQDNVGIQLNWTGTPTGTFSVQVSMDQVQDPVGNILTAGHWISLTLNPTISASGSADSAYIDLNQISAPWIRVVYTRSSGTGTLNTFVVAKGV